ncbi:hypothetical protein PUN28_018880 [Cardiocondyla obscurior]|uniref:Uncharacterized protein n=1 Tax=Cardiocondyla obscurior TaxID=286306 RepID=A0AAW2EG50_9HYME
MRETSWIGVSRPRDKILKCHVLLPPVAFMPATLYTSWDGRKKEGYYFTSITIRQASASANGHPPCISLPLFRRRSSSFTLRASPSVSLRRVATLQILAAWTRMCALNAMRLSAVLLVRFARD